MNLLRRLTTGAFGAVLGVTSVIVIPLAAASPATAGDTPAGVACTAETGYVGCLRFSSTGEDQTFTVPAGVTAVRAKVWGEGSDQGLGSSSGSGGGRRFHTGQIAVTGGSTLTLGVGGAGAESGIVTTVGGGGGGGYYVTLLNGVVPTGTVTMSHQGTFVLDTATGAIAFTPVLGFSGSTAVLRYRSIDRYSRDSDSTLSVHVDLPPGPTAAPLSSHGVSPAL